jgi:hypothetical protein
LLLQVYKTPFYRATWLDEQVAWHRHQFHCNTNVSRVSCDSDKRLNQRPNELMLAVRCNDATYSIFVFTKFMLHNYGKHRSKLIIFNNHWEQCKMIVQAV